MIGRFKVIRKAWRVYIVSRRKEGIPVSSRRKDEESLKEKQKGR